jgi:hypothetical protein
MNFETELADLISAAKDAGVSTDDILVALEAQVTASQIMLDLEASEAEDKDE